MKRREIPQDNEGGERGKYREESCREMIKNERKEQLERKEEREDDVMRID